MKIKDIKYQSLSMLIMDFQICQSCKIVDRNQRRSTPGTLCPVCKNKSEGGQMYFNLNTQIVIDLMQEVYHSTQINKKHDGTSGKDIAVLLFFCSLREIVLDNLITEICMSQNIKKNVYERMLEDNKFYINKLTKLLPSLIGVKWNRAVSHLDSQAELDYKELDDFIKKASEYRNDFIHEGIKWGIPDNIGSACIEHIWPLVSLYVELHNEYVHKPYYINTGNGIE